MVEDARTHLIPTAEEARNRVAALSGWSDRAAFEADILARLEEVDRLTEPFFTPGARPTKPERPDLGTLGFDRVETAEAIAERWRSGGINATRSSRARRILSGLEPLIFKSLAAAASPDEALAEFDRFLSGLPGGVQILSLFESNPALLDLIVEICAAAPRLAGYLGRNSRVIDALLDQHFFEPLPDVETLTADITQQLAAEDDYERKLDAARRWSKEYAFRVGVQMLRGLADAAEAGRGFSAVAEASLRGLTPAVEAEFSRRYGAPPGRGAVVVAMGKLGSREMTATSDLDLIVIYDAAGAEASEGKRPLPVAVYYARFTQMLISAMTAPTAEGALYEIDMRLRPSGRQGTVATSLASFRRYQAEDAWTWEHMALTRARTVAGDASLATDVDAAIAEVIEAPRDPVKTLADIAEMRARVAEAKATDDPWEVKNARGGLLDIEFAAQAGALVKGLAGGDPPAMMLRRLAQAGWLSAADCDALTEAHHLLFTVQQVARIALDGALTPDRAGEGLRQALIRATDVETFEELAARLAEAEAEADAVVGRLLQG
jgi:glutamate-ammonia-ligase adenylyltransferase